MAFPFWAKMIRKMRRNITRKEKKEYETKRTKFQLPWIEEFPGLVHESGAEILLYLEIMYCEICRNNEITADKWCSMFLGTSAFKKDTLIFHWKSHSHSSIIINILF